MSFPTTNSMNIRVEDETNELAARIQGQVITPGDPRYDEARMGWNRAVDQRPALIVEAECAADIAEVVQFARRKGMGVAVKSTGHGGVLPSDGGMLINTARLKGLEIDPQARTARLEAGLQWADVLPKTQDYGLAPLLGSSSDVGVVGYTLGGGMGWLGRKYGMMTDSVLAFEMVSAEGQVLRASPEENPDLYWGLRGGGGAFGVITAMEIRLFPVDMVYGGSLAYPASMAKEVMQHFREWIHSAPEEFTSAVVLLNFPPIPEMPEMLRGKSFVMVHGCYAGPLAEGEALVQAAWRDWKLPVMDEFRAMSFRELDRISNDPVNPMPINNTGAWVRELSDEAIDTLIRFGIPQDGPPSMAMVELRHAGGAIGRGPANPGAFSPPDADLVLFCLGAAPTPEAHAALGRTMEQMKQELAPVLSGGLYMNFVNGQEARDRTADGFTPAALRRLRALKASVDPQNIFRYSFDIAPEK